ncbi:MAG: M42 family metallopeptidase [Oscillospiraceae bacterium]|nr:M42 family metallopeptidase [Oscillospiraceae bacterium]
MLDLVKELCALSGVSGCEDDVREYLSCRAAPFADSIRIDAMGNLIVFKKGASDCGKSILLTAHMDEVGMIIRRITEEGFLKFAFIGGVDRRVAIGKRVLVGSSRIPGVIGLKAYHLVNDEEEKRIPKLDEFYIDIGAPNRKMAETLVSPGDFAAFDTEQTEFGSGFFRAKAIDDRAGCAVLLRLLETPLPVDCTFAFTVQEEVGARGAFGAAFSVKPDIALVVESTTAADIPPLEPYNQVCVPGKGVVIPFMDGGTIYDKELLALLTGLARRRGIPWQTKQYISGGTDAQAIQRSRAGVRTAGIALAARYLHAPASVICIQDLERLFDLAMEFLIHFGEEARDAI